MSRVRSLLAAIAIAGSLLPSAGRAQSVTDPLSNAGFSAFNSCCGTVSDMGSSNIYHTGDYWKWSGLSFGPLTQASHLALHLGIYDAIDPGGFAQTFDVTLNGTSVGGFTVPNGFNSFFDIFFDFAPLSLPGTSWELALTQTSATVQPGYGSSRVQSPFESNVTIASTVPEPASLALLATGLLGVGFVARRRRTA